MRQRDELVPDPSYARLELKEKKREREESLLYKMNLAKITYCACAPAAGSALCTSIRDAGVGQPK